MELKWRLSHARGYLQLGMLREAKAELAAIKGEDALLPEVRTLRVAMLQESRHWTALRKLAAELAGDAPGEVDWWIIWAFAARRSVGLAAATRILARAEKIHPCDATIQFNLGCYACQRGDLDEATARVKQAVKLDNGFLESARTDPDLGPLREASPDLLAETR